MGKKKKKKKKIHKGPKKPTHRHKNVPMRVLKFYKVEGDGEGTEYKVSHERIECPLFGQVQEGATVYALAPVDGGKKKKKKKKIHKGPKKPTHRHKNVPMRVLKFYKVEGDGEGTEYKVSHERIECPHPDCGAGVF